MEADANYTGPNLQALAEPTFFKPYIIVNNDGHLESTHVIRWCYEKICGAFGGADMCNKTLIRLTLLQDITDSNLKLGSPLHNDIKNIAKRAGIVDYSIKESAKPESPKRTLKKEISEYLHRGITNDQDVSKKLKELTVKYYKENKEKLSIYSKILAPFLAIDDFQQMSTDADDIREDVHQEEIDDNNTNGSEPISHLENTTRTDSDAESVNENDEGDESLSFEFLSDEVGEDYDEYQERLNQEEKAQQAASKEVEEAAIKMKEEKEAQEIEHQANPFFHLIEESLNEAKAQLPKGISSRTVCRIALDKILAAQNKTFDLQTINNGDCFYDAFAIGLSKVTGQTFTVQNLKDRLKNEVDRIHSQDPDNNWIKKACGEDLKKGGLDDYEKYRTLVGISYQTALAESKRKKSKGEKDDTIFPPWGRPEIDGELLCRLYNVKINVISVEVARTYEREPLPDTDPDKYFINEEAYPKGEASNSPYLIEIAAYPDHFMAVKSLSE